MHDPISTIKSDVSTKADLKLLVRCVGDYMIPSL